MTQNQNAYKFSLFDSYDYGTSAPKLEPVYAPETVPYEKNAPAPKKKKKAQVVVSDEVVAETKASTFFAVKLVFAIAFVFSLFAVAMYFNGKIDETATKIANIEADIKIAQSEYIRLSSILEGMVSIDKVEDYAVNKLGMVKLENYKITYFESDEDNHVVISGGKTYEDSEKTQNSAE